MIPLHLLGLELELVLGLQVPDLGQGRALELVQEQGLVLEPDLEMDLGQGLHLELVQARQLWQLSFAS